MHRATRLALNAVNRAFYADAAEAFSATRDHPWPGWERTLAALPEAPEPLRILDAGSGNGRFAGFLAANGLSLARYTGVDASEALLAIARARRPELAPGAHVCGDFVEDPAALPAGPFDLAVLFGVLHHVPGRSSRRALLEALCERLAPGGLLAVSAWRTFERERLARRCLPWSEYAGPGAGAIDPGELEDGDHLLRWQHDPARVRYVHFVDDGEWNGLVADLPACPVARFDADGRSGRDNRYALLRRGGA